MKRQEGALNADDCVKGTNLKGLHPRTPTVGHPGESQTVETRERVLAPGVGMLGGGND